MAAASDCPANLLCPAAGYMLCKPTGASAICDPRRHLRQPPLPRQLPPPTAPTGGGGSDLQRHRPPGLNNPGPGCTGHRAAVPGPGLQFTFPLPKTAMAPATTKQKTTTEPAASSAMPQTLRELQQDRRRRSEPRAARQGSVPVEATFTVLDNLPPHAPGWPVCAAGDLSPYVRYSNGSGRHQSDRLATCAASLSWCSGAGQRSSRHGRRDDVGLLCHPQLVDSFRNADEFVGFVRAAASPALLLPRAFGLFGVGGTFELLRSHTAGLGQLMPSRHRSTAPPLIAWATTPCAIHAASAGPARKGWGVVTLSVPHRRLPPARQRARRIRLRRAVLFESEDKTPSKTLHRLERPMPLRHRRPPDPAWAGHRLRPRPLPRRVHPEAFLRPLARLTAHRPLGKT